MSLNISGRILYSLGSSAALRYQIWRGYKTCNNLFSIRTPGLFFKVTGSTESSPRRTKSSKSYKKSSEGCLNITNMSDPDARKAELKKRLTPLQYHVTQEKGTERAYTGKYCKVSDAGVYHCIVCCQPLFTSETKFDSGCGWPAFNDVLDKGKIKLTNDTSNGMIRTEVTCAECGSHLGHVFNDGPLPTRKRFCINSASLDFKPVANASENATTLSAQK